MAGALDCPRQNALVLRAISRDAARHDFAFFGQKTFDFFGVFEIQDFRTLGAKPACLLLKKTAAAGPALGIASGTPLLFVTKTR